VSSLPSLFVVDTLGIIRYVSHGFNDKENFGKKLEKILSEVKAGTLNAKAVEDVGGEQVSVRAETPVSPQTKALAPEAAPSTKSPSAHQKWNAVMKVECGEPLDKVASETGFTVADIKKWHEELKNAAIKLWPEN
jgi:LysM repeat protein